MTIGSLLWTRIRPLMVQEIVMVSLCTILAVRPGFAQESRKPPPAARRANPGVSVRPNDVPLDPRPARGIPDDAPLPGHPSVAPAQAPDQAPGGPMDLTEPGNVTPLPSDPGSDPFGQPSNETVNPVLDSLDPVGPSEAPPVQTLPPLPEPEPTPGLNALEEPTTEDSPDRPAAGGGAMLFLINLVTLFVIGLLAYWIQGLQGRVALLERRAGSIKAHILETTQEVKRLMDRLEGNQQGPAAKETPDQAPHAAITGFEAVTNAAGELANLDHAVDDLRSRLDSLSQRVEDVDESLGSRLNRLIHQIEHQIDDLVTAHSHQKFLPDSSHPAPLSPVAGVPDVTPTRRAPVEELALDLLGRIDQTPGTGSSRVDPDAITLHGRLSDVRRCMSDLTSRARADQSPPDPDIRALIDKVTGFTATIAAGAGSGAQAGLRLPVSLAEYVEAHHEARDPGGLLIGYLSAVARSAQAPESPATGGESLPVRELISLTDLAFDILGRSRQGNVGMSHLTSELDRLFEALRTVLRSYNVVVQVPQEGQPIDPSTTCAAQSIVQENMPDQTVIKVIRCGLKNTMNGKILRQAEVIVTQKGS